MDFHPTRLSWASSIPRDSFQAAPSTGAAFSLAWLTAAPGILPTDESKDSGLSISSRKFGQPMNYSVSLWEVRMTLGLKMVPETNWLSGF